MAAALSAAVIVSLSVPIVAFWMYKTKSKYKFSNSEQHRKKGILSTFLMSTDLLYKVFNTAEYEEVVGEVTLNTVYENPMTMKLEA